MLILERYIAKTVLFAMVLVLGVMASVDLIFSLAEELGDTTDNYRARHVLSYVLFTLPTGIYELLPYAALGGALIGLGILASHNELVVIRAAGVNTRRVIWAVMQPTMLVMLFSLVLGEWVAPQLEQRAQSQRALIQSGGEAINTPHGDWRKIGNEFIHFNAIAPGGRELHGVTRYRLDEDRRLLSSSFAAQGRYVEEGADSYWLLTDMNETRFAEDHTRVITEPEYRWDVDLSPQLLSVLLVRPDRQSISGLYRLAGFFESEGLESANYYLAYWKKLLQPLATVSLVLLAISFVFGPLREATMGYRVFVGIMIGLGFTIAQRMMGPTALLYGFSPVVAVLLPIMISAAIGVYLLRRV